MSDTEAETITKHRVVWKHIDIEWQRNLNLDALFAAVEPTPELRAQGLPPAYEGAPDTLDNRLKHWGWTCDDAYGHYRDGDKPKVMGVYWDYTWIEDDAILMARIAPFVAGGSRAFFRVVEEGSFHFEGKLEGWDFDGTTVTRKDAESHVEYEWA
jgi:hypothetical protein